LRLGLLVCAALLVTSAGCGKKVKPVPPTKVTGVAQASGDCNPDVDGNASPLIVRIYELKSARAFKTSDFLSLYDDDGASLGADLIERADDLRLVPNGQLPIARELKPDTHVLAVFGQFRDYDNAVWGATYDVPPQKTSELKIDCKRLILAITGGVKEETEKKKKK
jgi:type VI secretion system protein VasD